MSTRFFLLQKIFWRGGVICEKFVRCTVRGSDGPYVAPYRRDMVEENKKIFLFKKISSVFASASCGNRSREVNSRSLLLGDSRSLVSSEKYFHGNGSIRDTQAISNNFWIFVDDFKKSAMGGVIFGKFVRCWVKGSKKI